MSRVAKAHINLPDKVELSVQDGTVTVKGPKGVLVQVINGLVKVGPAQDNPRVIVCAPASNDPNAWAQAGTARALLNNMVTGVTVGFTCTLELVGVGYRAQAKPGVVSLSLGFSHTIEHALPTGVVADTPNNTTIILSGNDKQLIGQVASDIRAYRPPEPYKGKGIKRAGEHIMRKEAKKK